MIDFTKIKISPDDEMLILYIAKRAEWRKRMDTYMDLMLVHSTVGLRLGDLLAADASNFNHDVAGIARHLNRDTGKLEDCFVPRFAERKTSATVQ